MPEDETVVRPANVLLTCVGRRNYLVRFFRDALGSYGKVFAADTAITAPALQDADQAFLLPPLDHPAYVDRLFALCRQHEVHLIVPLHDRELPLLAAHRARFLAAGIWPIISSPSVVATCGDKWETLRFLRRHGFDAVPTYCSLAAARTALARGLLTFPVMIKPRWGSASIAIDRADNEAELELAYALAARRQETAGITQQAKPSLLIQQWLPGQEYGLDIINDLNGIHVATIAKRKLLMRAGETDRAITTHDDRLLRLGAAIGERLGHVGNLDCDVIMTETTCHVIDMNPRFGGGYPFSHAAGVRLPSALVAWANGTVVDPTWFDAEPDVLAAKYDTLVTVEPTPRGAPTSPSGDQAQLMTGVIALAGG